MPSRATIVEGGRIDIAAQAVGIGEACLEQSIAKAKDRRQFGRPIAEFEAIQWMVADMSTEIDAARLLMFRAAAMRAKNPDDGRLTMAAAMAKLFASEAANRAAYNAVQIFGGHGYLTEYPVERLLPRCPRDDAVRGDVGDRAAGDRTRAGEVMTR